MDQNQSQRERNKCLLLWIQSLPPFLDEGIVPQNEHFKDGMMTSRILKRSVDPDYFADLKDSPNDSTQLVNVVKKMEKYISAHQPVASNMFPNCGKIIASGDIQEINRLIQFILGCAVNSRSKNEFVPAIMDMEETVQVDLMKAIQELLPQDDRTDLPDIDFRRINNSEIATLNELVEQLSQTNHNLTVKLSEITEEKVALIAENDRLNTKLTEQMNDPESIHVTARVQDELKKESEFLREDNYRLETTVDDLKLKLQVMEKQVQDSQSKVALCTTLQEEVLRHKDEMDSLREAAAKAKQYETSIQQYKNKLEGMDFLKRSKKELEDKNEELNKTNMHLEDEVKKVTSYKIQAEDLKKKLIETSQTLSQENTKSRRLEFESRQSRDKIESLTAANETLREEKRTMAQLVEEMKLGSGSADGTVSHGDSVDSIELLAPSVRQRITRLELENKELKKKINSGVLITSDEGSKVLVEALRKREAELDEELLTKSQEFIDLQASCDEKVRRLEAQCLAKEEELKKKELQYKKHIEKAKSVIETLEPTQAAANLDSSKPDREMEKARAVREMEEKLMASAFYNYGLTLHRTAVETKNTTLLQKHRNNASARRRSEI